MWFVYVLIGVVLLFATIVVLGVVHMRHSIRAAERAIGAVSIGDIRALCDECVSVFVQAFHERLDLDDFEESCRILSGRLDESESLKRAFAKDDLYWYFVLPVGAFLGELLRVHLNGSWRESELGGLEMVIPVGDERAQTFPFHKVIKHVTTGDPGDIHAYLESSRQLDKVVERMEEETSSGS